MGMAHRMCPSGVISIEFLEMLANLHVDFVSNRFVILQVW
jgi:hypothetical protein